MLVLIGALVINFNMGVERINQGVSIGRVDVSGKTAEEAESLVKAAYNDQLARGEVVIYADEETASNLDIEAEIQQREALAEQISWDEDRQNRRFWIVNAELLGSSLDMESMISEAMAYGRSDDPSLQPSSAGYNVSVKATFDDEKVESVASAIDDAIGDPRIDYNIAINDGDVGIVEGHDGRMVDRETLKNQIQTRFFALTEGAPYIVSIEDAPSRTTLEQATALKESLDAALDRGVTFVYKGSSYDIPREHIAKGIVTDIVETESGWSIAPSFNVDRMRLDLVTDLHGQTGAPGAISFSKDAEGIFVRTDGAIEVPKLAEAIDFLQDELLGKSSEESVSFEVAGEIAPEEMPLDDAISWGVVERISRFTTQFVNSTATQNRTHNIGVAASLLTDSIIESGDTWSFNDTAGECTEEKGYKGAGAIVNDEYTDAVGGGICQVATTVFNAVYSAGYRIDERHNHSLYISSYPSGRDAAIAYPYMDLRWTNDTESDVLMTVTTAEDSITVTLYGKDPGYEVVSEAGEWEEGEEFTEVVEKDDTLAPDTSYVKTAGVNGSRITVYRTVTDANGDTVRTDSFVSVYDPVKQVVVEGPAVPSIASTLPTSSPETDTSTDTALSDASTENGAGETSNLTEPDDTETNVNENQ